MIRICIIILTISLTGLLGCKNEDRKFPHVKKLSAYKQTEFLPTLEHDLPKDKNAIYCVTLLYAWDEIRKLIEQPLIIDNSCADLAELNNSKTYLTALKSNEYNVTGDVNGETITARAEFSK